jgi:exodeoxyribonuclease V alpha subunit
MKNELIENLRNLGSFHEIDFQFADYIVKTEAIEDQRETLYLATLCLSYYANLQHSLLPLDEAHGQNIADFCKSEEASELVLNFPADLNWLELFPKTIGLAGEKKPLILSGQSLYLNKYHQAEETVANFITSLGSTRKVNCSLAERLNVLFALAEGTAALTPDWQKVAAFMALRTNFCVISGGPGTGKTTTVGKILALLLEQNPELKVDLVAPTGKAADRLGESITQTKVDISARVDEEILTGIPETASTIHRYLSYHGGSKGFRFNVRNKTKTDLLLIDESSMVDLPLFRHLLSALKKDCRVILLGDKDQLTAVETGNVLGDLTASENINTFSEDFCQEYAAICGAPFNYQSSVENRLNDTVVKLEHSYRFQAEQGVGQLAYLINRTDSTTKASEYKDLFSSYEDIALYDVPAKISFQTDSGFQNIKMNQFFSEYKTALIDYHKDAAGPAEILDLLKNFRILSATRSGSLGSENLNELISKEFFYKNDHSLYHGRCVMIKKNNKSLEIYNGDVGVILHSAGKSPMVYFPGANNTMREFSPTILPEFETAFAMTIHKSQGSEYRDVILMLSPRGKGLMTKELIYTGATRAKESVGIYTKFEELLEACRLRTKRYSGLANRLQS